jgi:hypothetical protein
MELYLHPPHVSRLGAQKHRDNFTFLPDLIWQANLKHWATLIIFPQTIYCISIYLMFQFCLPSDILVWLRQTNGDISALNFGLVVCKFPLGEATGASLNHLRGSTFRRYEPAAFVVPFALFPKSSAKTFPRRPVLRLVICISPLPRVTTKDLLSVQMQ